LRCFATPIGRLPEAKRRARVRRSRLNSRVTADEAVVIGRHPPAGVQWYPRGDSLRATAQRCCARAQILMVRRPSRDHGSQASTADSRKRRYRRVEHVESVRRAPEPRPVSFHSEAARRARQQ